MLALLRLRVDTVRTQVSGLLITLLYVLLCKHVAEQRIPDTIIISKITKMVPTFNSGSLTK